MDAAVAEHDVLRALRGGPATLDALAARLVGGASRDALLWVLGELTDRGLVACTGSVDCGLGGRCSTSVPLVWRLTDAGRAER